ncbi:MAG TPA: hypothetical protein VK205_09945 [Prolixibacteraceae bacterium]|nr:hypothetical protein [Prolixibacteraceae bacterium]
MSETVSPKHIRNRCQVSFTGILKSMVVLLVVIATFPVALKAQDNAPYEEISVLLNIQKIGGADIPAVIVDETVYLPVADIFTLLKVKNTPSAQLDSVSGFFINQAATYLIDRIHNRITFQDKVYDLKPADMVKTETALYLKSNYFGQIFGLDCTFNFRSLSVMLTTKLELPIIKEMKLAEMRNNISRLKGEVKTDTVIGRSYPLFHFGMADWSVNNNHTIGGRTDTRLNLDLGTVIAGGEANIRLNYNNNTPFDEKQQQYLWRLVNNEQPVLRQVMAGKINTPLTSSIFNPIVGIQLTNTPTTYRRSFGTYTISDITEPNWVVELYVNNVLVDYMKADASGFYKFEVPMVYGNSAVKLKFYGPWGEERVKEQNISIPFNFLPPKELEYTLSAGIVEDTISSRFSRASMNYGLNRRMTVGGGIEYLSSLMKDNAMPFVSTSVRLLSGFLLTGEYTYMVRGKGMLSYRFPSNLQFEVNYTKYHPGQTAIIYNYLEERKATVSIPVKGRRFSAYSRFSVNQIVLPSLKTTNAEMLWSGSLYGISTNFTTYGLFNDFTDPYIYSNLSLAFRLPRRYVVTPQAQYDYNKQQLISVKSNLEKPLFKNGYLNLSYEQNFRNHTKSIEFGFRFDLAFAQSGFSFRNTNDQNTFVESARGSLLYDRKSHYAGTSNRSSVGKGGISILPFLDVNGNGRHEKGEPKVTGLQFRINGGTIFQNEKDTIIRVLDLVPYTSYLLELDKNSFDNIAWQMHNTTMKVMVDPNQFKTIEVPIFVMGEAAGTVYKGSVGLGRILICIYRDSRLIARTLTESDGYYSYLGMKPGKYTVRIDPEQLKKINMVSTPEKIEVTYSNSVDGDIKDGLDFNLRLQEDNNANSTSDAKQAPVMQNKGDKHPATAPNVDQKARPSGMEMKEPAKKDVLTDKDKIKEELMQKGYELDTITLETKENDQLKDSINRKITIIDNYGETLEVASFKYKSNAFAYRNKIEELTGKSVGISYMNLYYAVYIAGFENRKIALQTALQISEVGYETPFVSHERRNTSSIRLGQFLSETDALAYREEMKVRIAKKILVIYENNLYKVMIPGFKNHKAAVAFANEIGNKP